MKGPHPVKTALLNQGRGTLLVGLGFVVLTAVGILAMLVVAP